MREKILDKITKILAKTNNNNSSEECDTALLLAQRLMVENGISMEELNLRNATPDEIIESSATETAKPPWWQGHLASIIAKNFRCKVFTRVELLGVRKRIKKLTFLGYPSDVKTATSILLHARELVSTLSSQYIKKIQREYKDNKGVTIHANKLTAEKNAYISGYLTGLTEKFKKQVEDNNWGLVVVTPKDVEEKFNAMSLKHTRNKVIMKNSERAKNEGHQAGLHYQPSSGYLGA
jgi:ribosomal protein S17E